MRSVRAGLPFRRLPRMVIKQMARFVIMWLNAFPCRNGVSNTFSPRTIITGTTMSYRLHARLPFGAHAEIHDNPDPSNLTSVARTSPALCCGPTGDHRGTYTAAGGRPSTGLRQRRSAAGVCEFPRLDEVRPGSTSMPSCDRS